MTDYDSPLYDPEDDPEDDPEVYEIPDYTQLPLWDDPYTIDDRSLTA